MCLDLCHWTMFMSYAVTRYLRIESSSMCIETKCPDEEMITTRDESVCADCSLHHKLVARQGERVGNHFCYWNKFSFWVGAAALTLFTQLYSSCFDRGWWCMLGIYPLLPMYFPRFVEARFDGANRCASAHACVIHFSLFTIHWAVY